MNIKINSHLISGFAGATLAFLMFQTVGFTDQKREYAPIFPDNYKVVSVPIPNNINFAGEKIPTDIEDIKERFERELLVNTYWHSQTLLMIKRANRWFPVIEPILKENGVPDDFKYLALIESGFLNLTSSAGAKGFWQFLDETGKMYKLEINKEVDERYHVEKATEAACKYLKEAHSKLGSWSLAAGGYNMGNAGIGRQLTRQKSDNYYDLFLNEETSRYVFRILAAKAVLENPKKYGFFIDEDELYKPYKFETIQVSSSIPDIGEWAKANNTSYKHIKLLNPWLRDNSLTVSSGKTYEIKIMKN